MTKPTVAFLSCAKAPKSRNILTSCSNGCLGLWIHVARFATRASYFPSLCSPIHVAEILTCKPQYLLVSFRKLQQKALPHPQKPSAKYRIRSASNITREIPTVLRFSSIRAQCDRLVLKACGSILQDGSTDKSSLSLTSVYEYGSTFYLSNITSIVQKILSKASYTSRMPISRCNHFL